MKTSKLYIFLLSALAFTACTKDLTEGLDKVDVNVVASENVTMEGGIVTVRKGTPVEFSIAGEPDFITFFSGFTGKGRLILKIILATLIASTCTMHTVIRTREWKASPDCQKVILMRIQP